MRFSFEWIFRIIASLVIGILIGHERYSRNKEAGVRTHAIVCLGSCLIMLVSAYGFDPSSDFDPSRMAAQVVSGIGFLGAGLIFFNKGSMHGLTTAAGVWVTSAIGLAFGAGMYEIGFISGILIYLLQKYLHKLYPYIQPFNTIVVHVHMKADGNIEQINNVFTSLQLGHDENRIISADSNGFIVETEIISREVIKPKMVKEKLEALDDVIEVEYVDDLSE